MRQRALQERRADVKPVEGVIESITMQLDRLHSDRRRPAPDRANPRGVGGAAG